MSAADPGVARLESQLRSEIHSRNRELRTYVDTEKRRLEKAVEQHSKTTRKALDQAGERLTALTEAQDTLQHQITDGLARVREDVSRLTSEVHHLVSMLRRADGVVPVDLDAVPADLEPLLTQVRAVEDLRLSLLDEAARSACRQQIKACEQRREMLAGTRRRVLAASRELAGRRAGSFAFGRAAARYRTDRAGLAGQEAALARAEEARAVAESKLRRDAAAQQEHRDHPGTAGLEQLTGHVRHRLDTAVAAHALFPAWFTATELESRPVATRAHRWREAAVQVVLYRLVHRVDDQVVALGPVPAGGHQAVRHAAVQAALRHVHE